MERIVNLPEVGYYLYKMFDDKVSFNTYSSIPNVKTTLDTDFVVISVNTPSSNNGCFNTLKVVVEIFAKSVERGLRNNPVLINLQTKFIEVITKEKQKINKTYRIQSPIQTFEDYDERIGYHIIINTFNLQII